jgi:hypothetical protein
MLSVGSCRGISTELKREPIWLFDFGIGMGIFAEDNSDNGHMWQLYVRQNKTERLTEKWLDRS